MSTVHRWAVDAIDEGIARIEEDGRRMISVPSWLLPAEAAEGHLLRVTRAVAAGSSTVTISLDPDATSDALAKSGAAVAKLAKASRKRDPGGDVAL